MTEQNGAMCTTPEEFYMTCEVASIMGTLQAGYTDFPYVDKTSPAKEIFEREALLGCSITGFTSNPDILFNEEILKKGATIVKETNRKIASLIGIKPAARTTCTKPSGNASVLLMTPSGIHGDHSARFFRCIQVNKQEEIGQKLKELMPKMFEESVWSANNTDWVMYVPIENTNNNSLFKDDLLGVDLLEKVLLVQKNWVEEGTNIDLCVNSATRHNVSNTINVDGNWDEVRDYIYNNRKWFAGVSLLSNTGDKDYAQAPFTSVKTESEILLNYGKASLFASGLIVDGLAAFNNDLWKACTTALFDTHLEPTSENALKIDWVRRFNKFAETYYTNDKTKTSYLLKDVALLHKWEQINNSLVDINWNEIASKPNYSSVSSTSAIACSGGSCELF